MHPSRSDPPPESARLEPVPKKKDPLEFLQGQSPIVLILVGIVIGVLIINMRPIVVQTPK